MCYNTETGHIGHIWVTLAELSQHGTMMHEKNQKSVRGAPVPKCNRGPLFLYDHQVNLLVHCCYVVQTICDVLVK